jgi:long-chain fatty acid transport protein
MVQRGLKDATQAAAKAVACGLIGLTSLAVGSAQATEGYFQHGYGARQQALGGAGVADSRDAMALSLNPAGLVDVGRQFQLGASLFMPYRSYTASGTAMIAPGTFDSGSNYFVVPNIAYSSPIDADSAWGFALFGNGGMNTNWRNVANGNCALFGLANQGVYCGGTAGVDLMQAFLALGYARKFGALSFGISPVIAIQRFKAQGLSAFGAFGLSSDPAHLTDNGYSYSYGAGVRAGVQWSVAPNVRIGVSGQTPMWMTKFGKYSGLFAEGGDFDIPGNITAGLAWDAMPNLTLMFDYKHIFYGSIPSIANPMASPMPAASLGLGNGSGFGWHDVDIFKVGVEWRASPVWTFRLGYAHNTNPIKSTDVTFNILAPGVVTDHFTGGLAYKVTPNSTIELAAAYVPRHSISGPELTPGGPTPGSNIELAMHQYQFTLGWTYEFSPPKPAGPPVIHK